MEDRYLSVDGEATAPEGLTFPKARDLAVRLSAETIPHAVLVECRQQDGAETVVFDVRVQVPSRRVHPIQRCERVAVTFNDGDHDLPSVEALRRRFPQVPHLNLHIQEYPRSLCLYDERYEELKRSWTSTRFVQRVRWWLELTARGELHRDDQPLERILMDYSGWIVLPPDLSMDVAERLFVTRAYTDRMGRWFLLTKRQAAPDGRTSAQVVVQVQCCEPRTHGVINRRPVNLADVATMAEAGDFDVIARLREALPVWKEQFAESQVVLVLVFPKARTEGGPVEDHDVWSFVIGQSVRQIGIGLGIWEEIDGNLATLLEVDDEKRGQGIAVDVLNPCFELTRDLAARLNERPMAIDARIVGVGLGALGSQVVINLARAGFGRWTVIDPDRLMPHNLARHALSGDFVGLSKAEAVAYAAGTITFGDGVFVGMDADLLASREKLGEIESALSAADAILDMTASVAVQRHLARDLGFPARRLCAFLTPSGSDLIVLAEDVRRHIPLDTLEMQYYRALLNNHNLAGHLEAPGTPYRYGRSCGDTTAAISQDLVSLHAAIASRRLKEVMADDAPFIGVWRADGSLGVRFVAVDVRNTTEFDLNAWTVVLDEELCERLRHFRDNELPNETGGVLLGSFDLERHILYIVDTIPSPPDSQEQIDLYIRGCKGLGAAVEDAGAKTGGMLEYIGEWHSHPPRTGTRPSDYDVAAFGWLKALMSLEGLPPVMMIVGDDDMSLFVDSIGGEASPIPEGTCGEAVA